MNMHTPIGLDSVDVADASRSRRKRLIIGAIVVVALLAAAYLAFGRGGKAPAAKAPEIPNVTVVVPGQTLVADQVRVTGTLAAKREMPVGVQGEGGMITSVLVEPGTWVRAGQVLARISTEGGAVATSAGGSGGEDSGDSEATAPQAAAPDATTAVGNGAGELLDIIAPSGGESVTEATVLDWIVEQGATVADGDPLLEVSTDKVDMELPSPGAGVLVEVLVSAGDTIVPGQLLGRVQLARQAQRPAVQHDQPRRADQQAVGQVHLPAQQHADVLFGQQLLLGQALHQVGGDIEVTGAQGLLHRFVQQALAFEPAAGTQLQVGQRLAGLAAAQQVGEQMVIAEPVAMLVQRH